MWRGLSGRDEVDKEVESGYRSAGLVLDFLSGFLLEVAQEIASPIPI